MKKITLFTILLLVVLCVVEIGCKGDAGTTGPTGPTGPGGPSLMGNTSGLVSLIDTNGALPTNKSGITVSVEGTSKTAVTDSTGHWIIDSLTTGVYTIDISKATYGSTKIQNFQFIGGGTTYLGDLSLSEVPNFQVSNLTYTTGTNYIDVSGTLTLGSPQATGRNILLFVGNTSNVSSTPANYLGVFNGFATGTSTTFTQRLTTANLTSLGIGTGSPAFIMAYSSSAVLASSSRYVDQTTGKFIYTSLGNPSGVLQVVSPENKPIGNKGNR